MLHLGLIGTGKAYRLLMKMAEFASVVQFCAQVTPPACSHIKDNLR